MKAFFLSLATIMSAALSQTASAWPVICSADCVEVSGDQCGGFVQSNKVMASANLPEDAFKKLAAKCTKTLSNGTRNELGVGQDANKAGCYFVKSTPIPATIANSCVDLVL